MKKNRLIIIGSGPAGYTAAIYAARADLKPLLFTGQQPGGQLTTTTDVENWPGESEGILGTDLMNNLKKQALRFGTEVVDETVVDVDFSSHSLKLKTDQDEYETSAVILATGASARWLNVPGEEKLKGKGVSACATCDGFFFRDKKVVLVGGGDSAMEEAIFLTRFAESVTVLVRRDELRASKIMQKRAMDNPKITFMWNSETKELIGEDKLEIVRVLNNKTQEEVDVPADGFFVAIGHKPNVDFLNDQIELDTKGYIKNQPDTSKTSVDGVFACGDVIDSRYRQAITSAGTGCMSALDAEKWLINQE